MSTPALKSLRHLYPDARISVWVVPRAREILEGLDCCNEIISFDIPVTVRRGLRVFVKLWKLKGIIFFIFSLRKKRFDISINMRPLISFASSLKMATIFGIVGSKYKIGRDTEGRGFFLTHKSPEKYISRIHEVEHQLNLARILGGDIIAHNPEMRIFDSDIQFATDFLSANGIQDSDVVIGINPGAPWPSKRWPAENFGRVISVLSKEPGYRIIVTGSAEEGQIANILKEMSGGDIIDACGKTTLKQLAALMKRFNLYITNDTGSMHIAASAGVPMVAIFRPGHIQRNSPYMPPERYIILSGSADCAPCQLVTCASLKCLKSITPEEVIKASSILLDKFKIKRDTQ
jgi:ADP-heptose:LPS heptosyltransferase